MKLAFSARQKAELDAAARRHPLAHVRARALAVWSVVFGRQTRQEAAKHLPFSALSIGRWVRAFRAHGVAAFRIAAGRGRPSHVDLEEVRSRLRCTPERFGVDQTRWTLRALTQACPTLAEFSESGVRQVLRRLGFRYKRGQPWVHSPDPAYDEKKTPSRSRTGKRGPIAR